MKTAAAPLKEGPRINRDIRARDVQLIDAEGKNSAKKESKINHAGKAPRRVEPEPVKAQMPGRSKKVAASVVGKPAAKKTAAQTTVKSAAKTPAKTVPKATAKTLSKTPMKMVKVNDPAKAPKRTAAKSALKPVAKRAPAAKTTSRKG